MSAHVYRECGTQTHGDTTVPADDGDNDRRSLTQVTGDFCDEGRRADDVERRDTEDPETREREQDLVLLTRQKSPLRVEDSVLLEDLSDDGDSRVDRVRDNEDECLRSMLRDAGGEVADDTCIDLCAVRVCTLAASVYTHLEKVITLRRSESSIPASYMRNFKAHRVICRGCEIETDREFRTTYSRLPRHTSGDDDDVGTGEDLGQTVIRGKVADDLGGGRDVGQICCDTGRVDNIVQTKLSQKM